MNFLHSGSAMQFFCTGAGALWVFSAAVSAMNPPTTKAGFYGWLYRFTHLLAANLDRALGPAPTNQQTDVFNKEEQ